MNQNGVVCLPGPALLFFIFRFEFLILGPKSYRDIRETGPEKMEKEGRKMITGSAASPSPQLPPFFFFVFALSQFRVPDYLGAGKRPTPESGAKETKFFGAVVIFM